MAKYGIPYMGTKDKVAESISMIFQKAAHFYDLFGGGFSISHCMLLNKRHRFQHFHYNEIKADIVDLVKRAVAGEFNYDSFKPKWISREDFFANLDDPYIRVCWSFGNNQKTYLFGDIEPYKKSMHMAVIFDQFDDTASKVLGFSCWPSNVKTVKQRRSYLRQKVAFDSKGMSRAQLEQLERLERLQQLQELQQLQRLERLERLQRLERFEQLHFTALDYRAVEIQPNSVVYCDIPYQGTECYGNNFNHKDFFDWAASRSFPVYISEYNIDDPRFKLVYTVDKRSMLSAKKSNTIMSEKVYWNGVTNA